MGILPHCWIFDYRVCLLKGQLALCFTQTTDAEKNRREREVLRSQQATPRRVESVRATTLDQSIMVKIEECMDIISQGVLVSVDTGASTFVKVLMHTQNSLFLRISPPE